MAAHTLPARRPARGVALLLVLVLGGCVGGPPSGPAAGPPDREAAAAQARTFATIATPDRWGNYGEQFSRFCEVNFGFDCNRPERSRGEDLNSAQEIQQWDAEKNNPGSVLADIGIIFIPQAEQAGILADYRPPNVNLLPEEMYGDGWLTTFVGVPGFMVNADFFAARGLPLPNSWADLTNPAYEGMIGLSRVGISGGGTWGFVAMNLAAGGTLDDYSPGIEFGRRLLPNLTQQASVDTFERGEVPITIRYDFQLVQMADQLRERGVNVHAVIPSEGSVYAPSALMMNRYDTANHDFAKLFMEWVLTDEAQVIFAKFGARPIRSIVGDQRVEVPDEWRVNWLPDEMYENVITVDYRNIDSDRIAEMWENEVVGGAGQ